jgi:phage shock protein A
MENEPREALAQTVLDHISKTSDRLQQGLSDLITTDRLIEQRLDNAKERQQELEAKVEKVVSELKGSRMRGIQRATALEERATSLEREVKELKGEIKDLRKLKESSAVYKSKIGGFDKNWALIFGLIFMIVSVVVSILINNAIPGG